MKNFNKLVIILLGINFLISLYGIFLLSSCNPNIKYLYALPKCDSSSTYTCLWCKEGLFSDFYYQYNTLRYTGVHGVFPSIGIPNDVDGGFDGASFYGKDTRIIYHPPVYYYLAGFLYVLSKSLGLNDLLILHIFSAIIILFTNILFYFFVKKISKYFSGNWKRFIIYSLALFVVLPTSIHMSIGVQSDGLFYLSIIASFLVYSYFLENKNLKNGLLLGITVGLSSLVSNGGVVVLFALFIYLVKVFIKKEYKTLRVIIPAFIVSFVLGVIPWIRIYILTGLIYGDMHSRSPQSNSFLHLFHKFYDGISAFWGGIYGGLSYLKPLLFSISVLLILLSLIGLILYFKDIRKKVDLDFIILTYFFTIVFVTFMICNPFLFLKTGNCYGREIQNRYLISLSSLFPLFSTITLIEFQNKKPILKYFVYFFIVLVCSVFSANFIFALI